MYNVYKLLCLGICTEDQVEICHFSKKIVGENCLKKDIEIYIFCLRKLSRNWGQFSSTVWIQSNIWYKDGLLLTQY